MKAKLFSVCFMVIGGWLACSTAWADVPPIPVPATGGLPQCEAELAVCTSDLGTCSGDLGICNDDLGICSGDLGICNDDLGICSGDLDSCQVAWDACDTSLTTCNSDLGICTTELSDTTAELATCTDDLATCEATAGRVLPATGQTSCWDYAGNTIDCAETGHDGDIRAGAALAYTDNGDGTITDENTGLMWMKQDDNGGDCASYPGYFDQDCRFTWSEAFAFVAELNTEPCFAGHCDWRVPNRKELHSIVNLENINPAVSDAFNTNCMAGCTFETCSCTFGSLYWTSTSFAQAPWNAWYINFFGSDVNTDDKEDPNIRVRPVRGGL